MKLFQWRGAHTNFGDELNGLLWPRLLPDFFDQDPAVCFLGIGSVLDGRHDRAALKLVAGSGYGGYEAPVVLDETWIVHWVRGPRTAAHLGLPAAMGLGDPASLLPLAGIPLASLPLAGLPLAGLPWAGAGLGPAHQRRDIGFMPHFESAARGAWRAAAALAGVTLIDPRGDPLAVIAAIGRCRVLLSEALHGVIVADALRVPWIAIRPLAPIHRPKWLDWAETLNLAIDFHPMRPSTALERAHLTRLAHFHMGRAMLRRHAARLREIDQPHYIEQAAGTLREIAGEEPRLSRDALLEAAQSRMLEAIVGLRRAPMGGRRLDSVPGVTLKSARGFAP